MAEAALAMLTPFTAHGGRVDAARVAFPGATNWLDLSTGMAPWAYPVKVAAEIQARLPSPGDLTALEAAAASAFASDPAMTVAVPGSDIGLRLIGAILGNRRAAVVQPGYSGHRAMWAAAPTLTGIDDIAVTAAAHDVVVLARPTNPDGIIVDVAALEAAASSLARRGGNLVVDEAFADAMPEPGIAGRGWPGTIVLRSFGKFFGLAGLRLGFVIAPLPIVRALRRMLGDWPVSGAAIAAGTAAYRDLGWQAAQRARLQAAACGLGAMLANTGLAVVGETSLFRLVATPAAAGLFTHLANAAILTRPFAEAPQQLRFGLPDDVGAARLARALDQWRNQ